MNWRRYFFLLILIAGIVAYHNSFMGRFVFDDYYHIVENDRLRDSWPAWKAWSTTSRPIPMFTIAANFALAELNPWDYHLVNLIVHLLAALALYGVLRRTLLLVRKDCGLWTVDRRRGERALELQSDRALEVDDGGTRRVAPKNNEVVEGGSVASCADSRLVGHTRETPRPRGTVALQDQVCGHQSVVGSRGREAVLAGIIALIWVVHPLNTQAVTYIIQRMESMMGLFYLLTLYCFIRGVEADADRNGELERGSVGVLSKGESGNPPLHDSTTPSLRRSVHGPQSTVHIPRFRRTLWFALAIAACALGMGCKEVMATAPLMILVYDRLFVRQSWRDLLKKRRWFYAALIATWIPLAYLVLTNSVEETTAGFELETITPFKYALSQPAVILHYFRLSVLPVGQCFDYLWQPSQGLAGVVPPLLVISGMGLLTLHLFFRPATAGKSKAVSFPGLWFFGILSITSSIMPIADLAVEHRMYLPLIAVISVVVLGVYGLINVSIQKCQQRYGIAIAKRWATMLRILTIAISMVTVVSLITLTMRRNDDYRDPFVLWHKSTKNRPWQWRAYAQMGWACIQRNEAEKALPYLEEVVRIIPDKPQGYRFLGIAWSQLKDHRKAIECLTKAIALEPDRSKTHAYLGGQYAGIGEWNQAMDHYQKALLLEPQDPVAHYNMAMALVAQGEVAASRSYFEKAIELKPYKPLYHYQLAECLRKLGQLPRAIYHYGQACRLTNYQDATALEGWAAAASEAGDWMKAKEATEKLLLVARQTGKAEHAKELERRLNKLRNAPIN